jgi:hypothetical protein
LEGLFIYLFLAKEKLLYTFNEAFFFFFFLRWEGQNYRAIDYILFYFFLEIDVCHRAYL